MIAFDPEQLLREQIAERIDVEREEGDRFIVHMPFVFDDGEQCSVHARKIADNSWLLSDEGDTLQRAVDAGLDLRRKEQRDRLKSLVRFYGVDESRGRLGMRATDENLAESLFTFTQTCLETTWLPKSNRVARRAPARVEFSRKLEELVTTAVGANQYERDWHDQIEDPKSLYPVDFRIKDRQRQLFLFGVSSEIHCAQATITCLHFKTRNIDFESVVVYEDEGQIRSRYADRLNDVVDRRFPRVVEAKTITRFLANPIR